MRAKKIVSTAVRTPRVATTHAARIAFFCAILSFMIVRVLSTVAFLKALDAARRGGRQLRRSGRWLLPYNRA